MSSDTNTPSFANMRQEQLPIPKHKLHEWTHFVGLYAAEHVAATEFVIGATFVALGASTMDILVVAWIAADTVGAGAAMILKKTIVTSTRPGPIFCGRINGNSQTMIGFLPKLSGLDPWSFRAAGILAYRHCDPQP